MISSDEVAPRVLFFTAMPTSAADFTFLHGQWCRGSNIRRFNKRSRDECESHCRKADCVCFQYKDTPTQEEGNCRFTRADEYTDTRPSKMGFNAWVRVGAVGASPGAAAASSAGCSGASLRATPRRRRRRRLRADRHRRQADAAL